MVNGVFYIHNAYNFLLFYVYGVYNNVIFAFDVVSNKETFYNYVLKVFSANVLWWSLCVEIGLKNLKMI